MSLKEFKKLSKIEHNQDYVNQNRLAFFEFYFQYFYNIVVNYFTYENLPNDIDQIFIEKKLIENGHICFFEDDRIGYVAQSGTFGSRLNIYDKQLDYIPVNSSNFMNFKRMRIAYTQNDFNMLTELSEKQKEEKKKTIKKPCIIIGNNNEYEPYIRYIQLFCTKLADIELTIQLNRNAQITPYFVFCDNENVLSMKNLFNKIANFEPVVYLNKQKDKDGLDSYKQLSDYIQVYKTDAPYLLDKLHDEKLRVMNQLLTFIGINNNPTEKKERLVVSEAISNNGIVSANIEVGWKSRRQAVDLINKCYGLDIEVKPAEYIQQFNLDRVFAELENGTETIGEELE